jgi:altronate hydrolase
MTPVSKLYYQRGPRPTHATDVVRPESLMPLDEKSEAPLALQLDRSDDVAVALAALSRGQRLWIGDLQIEVGEDIPAGHKIALRTIAQGAEIRKYGWPIGIATAPIAAGQWVHSSNLRTRLAGLGQFEFRSAAPAMPIDRAGATFQGYRRRDGRVATRNEIWILCTVGCVARTAEKIARIATERFAGQVDGVHAFTHPFGCSQLGDDLARTRKLVAALARHPNAGGVLIVGLGCESNQLAALLGSLEGVEQRRLRAFTAQGAGDEIETGLQAVAELVAIAGADRREPCPLADLRLGLKCGGSDGLSGITANPLVGRMADRCVSAGGTAILTEIPETFGAEHLLLERAASREVFDRMVAIFDDFRRYFIEHDQPIHENPSPGNVSGGITTLEEKSLGAVQKGGRAIVTQALRYAETVSGPGLALLEAPGNDAVSSTALVAAGATVLLFTTGRGTPLGFPVPTLKIASNSQLASRKPGWIDFDAGVLLSGANLDSVANRLFDLVLATASGRPARNEINDEREIAIWKQGVTL